MNPAFQFNTAQRIKCKASIQIEGLTGKGKSGLALVLAHGLANKKWDKVFCIDTENKSTNLFVGLDASTGGKFGEFKVAQLTEEMGFKPSNYLHFRKAAIDAGAEVIIKDSISHAWQYKGGVLDLVAQAKTKSDRYAKDSYAAWSEPTVMKEKNELTQLLRDPNIHVITTVRVKEKMEYAQEGGKTVLKSLGDQQIQQSDLKYEPDLVLHMIEAGNKEKAPIAKVIKSRYAILEYGQEYEFTPELIEQLRVYLDEGADPKALMKKQQETFVSYVKGFLDENPRLVPIWKVIKKDAGHGTTKLEQVPLNELKTMFNKLRD